MTLPTARFVVGQRVFKRKGEYMAFGHIRGMAWTSLGTLLYVFEFDSLPGLVHLFREHQLEDAP